MDPVENERIGISSSIVKKMSRGKNLSMDILEKLVENWIVALAIL